MMAVAGGVTTAYRMAIVNGLLQSTQTSILKRLCAPVDDAVDKILAGEQVIVAGIDVWEVRLRLQKAMQENGR